MRRAVFFIDFDGTLLAEDKSMSAVNTAAVQSLLDAGHIVAFNTGRSISSAQSLLGAFNLENPDIYMINLQGNMIYHPSEKKVLYSTGIDRDGGIELLKYVNSRGIYAHTYSDTGIISVTRDNPQLKRYLEITGERLLCLNSWDELRDDIIPKVICINYIDTSGLHALYDEYRASGDRRYECFFSSPMYLEFTRLGVDKGLGVRKLCDMLDIPPSDCFAIGDEENDIPMLKEVGFGGAPKNATEALRAVADYVCTADNDNDAAAEFIDVCKRRIT